MSSFLYNQLFVQPSLPSLSFADQIVIVTGSNTGLGLEAARHIARLGARKVILAVRNQSAGEAARHDIETSTGRPGACEVWPLDLADYDSVISFAERVKSLPRLDAVIENAAIATDTFALAEAHERTVTVNVISTLLLGFLLLPKLRESARNFPVGSAGVSQKPRLSFVVSEVHAWAKFPQWKDERGILIAMDDEKTAHMEERYQASKLMAVLAIREMVARMSGDEVLVNMVNPGLCHSQLSRDIKGFARLQFKLFKWLLARTTEVGSRTLVAGASAGPEAHGEYMSNGVVAPWEVSRFVRSADGATAQKRLWDELVAVLDEIKPGVTKGL